MALRLSKALRNYIDSGGALKDALQGGKIIIYDGAQPGSAEAAPTGSALVTITDGSGAHTAEVQATGSVALLTGASGSVNTLTVNSIEIMGSATAFNTSLAQTAQDIVDKINANPKNLLFKASRSSNTVVITARRGLGALVNTWVVASTVTTITKTDTDMSGGTSSANGLKFGEAAAAVLAKLTSQTWSGVAGAAGVAGWFRFVGSVADSGALDSSELQLRMDGAIATSGAQINMSSTTVANGSTQTVSSFAITLPTL